MPPDPILCIACGDVLDNLDNSGNPKGYYLLCPHGNAPMHVECLSQQLEDALACGRADEYRRCFCEPRTDALATAVSTLSLEASE